MEKILKAYKKRERSLQRRISLEQSLNKRLALLLAHCNNTLESGTLKDMVENELKMLKFKYY